MKGLVGADKKDSGFLSKFLAGALAGAIGSVAGNPFDVLKTRMMANEGAKSLGLGHFAKEVYTAQGMGGFYKGIEANVLRAMILNATKMACYD
jgi:Mitochondrial carrier protein